MRATVMTAVLLVLAGCSSQPTTHDETGSGAAPVPPPPAAEVVVPAPKPDATQSAAGEKPGGRIPSGYRRETRGGKELYCRQDTTLGSRFSQKTCYTREQLEEVQRRTDSTMDNMERGMSVCGSAGACGDSN
jgi:hypothetical protein